MNQQPPSRTIADRGLEEKTLFSRISRELWPWAQEAARTLRAFLVTSPVSVTASEALDGADDLILADATLGNITLTLPTPEAWMKAIVVVKTDATANTVTVQTVSFANPVLAAQGDTVTLMQDSTAWYAV